MADATLLPCPFCGGGASIFRGNAHAWVICDTPGCGCEQTHDTRDQAIAAWNTRQPQLPSDDGLIKALEEARGYVDLAGIRHHDVGGLLAEIDQALSRHKAPLSEIQYNKVSKPL